MGPGMAWQSSVLDCLTLSVLMLFPSKLVQNSDQGSALRTYPMFGQNVVLKSG